MNSTASKFSLERIALLLKRDISENWRSIFYFFLASYIIVLLWFCLAAYVSRYNESLPNGMTPFDMFCYASALLLSFCISVVLCFSASRIFKPMSGKGKRIEFLMLPATHAEKFVSRVVYSVFGTAFVLFVVFLVAELTRILIGAVFSVNTWGVMDMWHVLDGEKLVPGVNYNEHFWLYTLIGFIWTHSLYILGGTYFTKHPFTKTLILAMLCSGLLSACFLAFRMGGQGNSLSITTTMSMVVYDGVYTWIYYTIYCIFAVVNWWLAYRIFVRSQVKERNLF